MKSPFPGMDPYLEQFWRTVHHNLITDAQDQISEQLPSGLTALIGERVFVESLETPRGIYPDVYVAEYPTSETSTEVEAGGVAVAEPVVIRLSQEPIVEGYVEIRDAGSGNRVVTVVEFLSPTNKQAGDGRDLYLQKQKECIASWVSLVEVDLVRQGIWAVSVPRELVPSQHRTTYQACVRRAWKRLQVEFYPIPLRARLPRIRVPLRETDDDVMLDLHALIERSYQRGRLGRNFDYRADPDPPLEPADAAWADELLRAAGVRSKPA
jgi:hypothetical protein